MAKTRGPSRGDMMREILENHALRAALDALLPLVPDREAALLEVAKSHVQEQERILEALGDEWETAIQPIFDHVARQLHSGSGMQRKIATPR